jgi:hypothetical protein
MLGSPAGEAEMKCKRGTLLLAALTTACGGAEPEGESSGVSEPLVVDSASVRIVENGRPSAARWRAEALPAFILGWGSGDPTFTWLQSGQILPDGGALVGEFAAGIIYRVGPDGSVVDTWGRKGQGPGEYQGLDALLVKRDSVLVSDGRLRRLTYLSWDGGVLTTQRLAGAFLHQLSSILPDGRLLLIPGDGYAALGETRPEWVFERQPILAISLEGSTPDTLAHLPHLRRWYGTRGGSPGPISMKGRAGGFTEGFAWARADQPEVRWYDGSGRLVQLARWEEDPMPLTPDWRRRVAQFYEDAFRSSGTDEAVVNARLAELEEGLDLHDAPLPYWDQFYVDRQGNAWLGEYALPGEPPVRWRVLTRDGALVGWIDLPDVAYILDIADDRILAVRLNELDVPALMMINLLKE